jgi:hypothetical protein
MEVKASPCRYVMLARLARLAAEAAKHAGVPCGELPQ